ncbi:ABC transporter permease [Arcobacter porcinus]|uniref:2-aminoethylphosphonate transport system permease protein PhnV n=1 Tax=Arcobacter porcinus TaxID=1935204 RepID=A0ABX2YGA2_9BACT|nr:iron ABC transporter permease [Arcobacter porcinus]OCL82897.1 putative 2-aminoethylphosphonate transport system permease protein PhnV [Arcobacter porcinus]OCL84474.1 putative 2-aminoethylphosphonate transport system permease protein PhnV [Arcobacter porcinus]OCL89015.1 putative 2-aminoethylphosphonate transport system permease protein PhnV [Arcobacter porcinus]OCL93543.1 putative 2-aminoethylphosphonate transport system permease protein PhnV [Arcobacter porcinus]
MEINNFKKYIAPIFGVCISFPILILLFYFLINSSFLDGFLRNEYIYDYTLDTITLVAGTMFGVLILGTITSYLSARFTYTGSTFFSICFVLPLAYPAYIFGYTYVGFFEFRGLLSQVFENNSLKLDILNMPGAIFIFTIAMFPYVYILARVSFSNISKTIFELVSLQNLSHTKAFFKVYLPLAYPSLFAGAILAAMETLSDYGTVLYFGIETFSVGIFKSWYGYENLLEAINVAVVLLIFVFSILLVEHNIRKKLRFSSSTNSSQKAEKIVLKGKQNFIAFLISFIIASITLFIPSSILIYWTFLDRFTLDFTAFDFLLNTLTLNIFSSAFIVMLAFFIVYFLRFYPTKISNVTHKMSMLGYSIPGAVVAVGLLIISNYVDKSLGIMFFGGSFIVLIFAYTTRYFAASIGSVENGFSKIPSNIDDVSKTFCKSSRESIFKIYLPLLKPYLLSGFLILYIDIAKELPATLILRPFNFDTLAVRIYELASNEMLYKTGFPSLILVITTATAVIFLNKKPKKR